MNSQVLRFLAFAASILYGVGFAVIEDPGVAYAVVGGAVCALAWVSVGYFGRDEEK